MLATVSDVSNHLARHMSEALINGERDPAVRADLARGRMRSKIPDLTWHARAASVLSTR